MQIARIQNVLHWIVPVLLGVLGPTARAIAPMCLAGTVPAIGIVGISAGAESAHAKGRGNRSDRDNDNNREANRESNSGRQSESSNEGSRNSSSGGQDSGGRNEARQGDNQGSSGQGTSGQGSNAQGNSGRGGTDKDSDDDNNRNRQSQSQEKDKNGKADKSGKGEKERSGKAQKEDDKPPATVAEWISGLLPSSPAVEQKSSTAAVTTGSVEPANSAKPSVVAANKAPVKALAKKNTAGRRDVGIQFPIGTPEVLGFKLSQDLINRAEARGFRFNGSVALSRVGLSMTRLLAPPGMSAEAARQTLQSMMQAEVPGQSLEVNQTYRIYRTASGTAAEAATPVPPPVAMATPCGTDRCYGAAMMGWQSNLESCTKGLGIGVIDTGFDASHPAFKGRSIEVRKQTSSAAQSGAAKSPEWHGTGVLGLLAGGGQTDRPGLIPQARFFMADAFVADADGQPIGDTVSVVEALNWLADKRVKIVNLSLAGPPDEVLRETIATMSRQGTIFIAAVGNNGPTAEPAYPAAYDTVIGVTAVSVDLKAYRYAGRGAHVDLAAPGVKIWTVAPGGRAEYHSGTSFAVPHATAVIAAIYNSLASKSKAEVLGRLSYVDLGAPGRDPIFGRGLVKAPLSCHQQTEPDASPVLTTSWTASIRPSGK